MQAPDSDLKRLRQVEAWSALILRIVAFVAGAIIVAYEISSGQGDDPKVRLMAIVAGVSMMGPVTAASVASIISAMRGRQDG